MPDANRTCFIAMPITVHDDEEKLYRDSQHWAHVMNMLFIPAIQRAGFTPIKPSAQGTSMIHGRIIRHLAEADLVLCDLSQHNPNVLFELGVRTSLNRPVALVKDEHLNLPFDIQGLNTHHYSSALAAWDLESDIEALATHIRTTAGDSDAKNPLWRHFGVDAIAMAPEVNASPTDAKLELILERVESLTKQQPRIRPIGDIASDPAVIATFSWSQLDAAATTLSSIDGVSGISVNRPRQPGGPAKLTVDTLHTIKADQRDRAVQMSLRLLERGFNPTVINMTEESVTLEVTPRTDQV